MLDLADTLGVKITAEPWDGTDWLPYMLVEAYGTRKKGIGDRHRFP